MCMSVSQEEESEHCQRDGGRGGGGGSSGAPQSRSDLLCCFSSVPQSQSSLAERENVLPLMDAHLHPRPPLPPLLL